MISDNSLSSRKCYILHQSSYIILQGELANRQMVSESKDKLRILVERMKTSLLWSKDSLNLLQKYVDECQNEIQKSRMEMHGVSTVEGKLQWLLNVEERLRMLKQDENCPKLWEEISKCVSNLYYALGWQGEKLEKLQYTLRMIWENNDAVWFLGCDPLCYDTIVNIAIRGIEWRQGAWGTRRDGKGSVIYSMSTMLDDIMQRIYPTNIETQQQLNTLARREQLLMTFQQRLRQWQDRRDSLHHLHHDLTIMLECWPKQRTVRTQCSGNNQLVCD